MIQPLPKWIMPGNRNAFDDFESLTNVEHVARIYKKMQELVDDYNKFVTEVESEITEATIDKSKEFKEELIKLVHDYIQALDMKIVNQNRTITESIEFVKINLAEYVEQIINTMKDDGTLEEVVADTFDNVVTRLDALENTTYSLEYEEGTEHLMLVKKVGGAE